MKKQLLFYVMALVALSVNAQFSPKPLGSPQAKSPVVKMAQTQRSYQVVGPRQDLAKRNYAPTRMLTLDTDRLKPYTRAQRLFAAEKPAMQSQVKALTKGKVHRHRAVSLQPTKTLTSKVKAPSKAPLFAKEYTGTGVDYFTGESAQWTMTPSTATYTNEETGEEEEVNVFVDLIPAPNSISSLYPEGIPVEFTVDENDAITIMPQTVASYPNETEDTTYYVTLFSVTSEDGSISLEVDQNGKLTITSGDYIGFGEFADVEFDPTFGEAYLGLDELIANVNYYYQLETTYGQKYNAHGVDYFNNVPVDWLMQSGTKIMDDETIRFFVDMTPLDETFSGLYPDGIPVEYEQEGSTITIRPQVIASIEGDEEEDSQYILLFSATSDDGCIVLTEEKTGLKTIEGESILIGAWSTSEFDSSFETYLGGYQYIDKPKYRTPDAPAEAPEDVACEPEELVLFAGLGYSGYSFNDNLGVLGAYAPTTLRNLTFDIATDFEWSAKETDADDVETTLRSGDRDFTINTQGGAIYSDFSLIAHNEKTVSEPFTWGANNMVTDDEGNPTDEPIYEAMHLYAGEGASSFTFSDGSHAVMTRQNPDYELTFYLNWATPGLWGQHSDNVTSMSTIYSYQGKPATPLYLTGVTLPIVEFTGTDDFELHIKLCKCERDARGNLTVGDIIAEGDATMDNVNADYDKGITAVEFNELYVEDEFGMSETVDYLFIEDEFVIIIEGWDNGTFEGVLGSQSYNFNEITSTWFRETGEDESGRLHSYSGGWPQLFIGLLDATYGYLYTEDDTELKYDVEGGTSTIHINPMYNSIDDETEEPTYRLFVEGIYENDEEVEEVPEWLNFEVANEDYTKATEVDEEGNEYTYYVNGIDYDLVVTAQPLPEGEQYRTAKVVFFQEGAKLTVTVEQGVDPNGISTIVADSSLKNRRPFNLAGQPVDKNYKGIVVKDGKKVLVK